LIRENGNPDPSSFWVAGDDAQAIYSFTGASVGNILNFQSMFPGSRQFILDLNYRSTPQILRACQNLIQFNVKQIHKDLKTDNLMVMMWLCWKHPMSKPRRWVWSMRSWT
jgi:DNA helicase-2/ATP-dependent DNA helicase PcrA